MFIDVLDRLLVGHEVQVEGFRTMRVQGVWISTSAPGGVVYYLLGDAFSLMTINKPDGRWQHFWIFSGHNVTPWILDASAPSVSPEMVHFDGHPFAIGIDTALRPLTRVGGMVN